MRRPISAPLPTRRALVYLGAAVLFGFHHAAMAADEIAVPSNVDFRRLQLLDRPDRANREGQLRVYVVIKGDRVDGNLLLSSAEHLRNITIENFQLLLANKIKETGRFAVFSEETTGVIDQSTIVVEGKVVRSTQHIEKLVVAQKAITRVGFSVQIKETDTGRILRGKTFIGHYGDNQGEGTVFVSDAEMRSPTVQLSLYKDYDRALNEALDSVAAYIESRYRPVGKVREISGDLFSIDGGEQHGFNGDDEVVVFRTKFSMQNGERVPGIMSGVARAVCNSVTEFTSTCKIAKGATEAIQKGDYVTITDASLRK